MPNKYKGDKLNKNEYVNSTPRKWTEEEIKWCKKMKEEGYTYKQIAESVGRTHTSVSIKMKRLNKSDNTYNKKHIKEKYETNKKFINKINPRSLLDVYAGNSFYENLSKTKGFKLITNDIDNTKETDYNLDALKLVCKMYFENNKFDVIDLDPFGSAFDCFDLSIKMANKGLIITFGEIGHKRFKRLDFVSRYYGINNVEDFTTDNLINKVQEIAHRNKKNLIVEHKKEWTGISRVYFLIEDLKITSQWD